MGEKFNWNTFLLQVEIKLGAFLPRSASLVRTPEKSVLFSPIFHLHMVSRGRKLQVWGGETFLAQQNFKPGDALVCACERQSPEPREGGV